MHSSWRADIPHEDVELVGEQPRAQGLLNQIAERSTSAPPLPVPSGRETGSSLPFNSIEGGFWRRNVGGRASPGGLKSLHLNAGFEEFAPRSARDISLETNLLRNEGRATAPVTDSAASISEAVISSGVPCISNSTSSQSFGGDSRFDFERGREEENFLVRSQSAAPEFAQERSFIPPPPGMSERRSRGSESVLVDGAGDADRIVLSGPRRPASTGVIGQLNSSSSPAMISSLGSTRETTASGAVRPAPKTLMDLIQEDFPNSPSPVYHSELNRRRSSHLGARNQIINGEPAAAGQSPTYTSDHQEFRQYDISQEDVVRLSRSMDCLQVVPPGKVGELPTPSSATFLPESQPRSPPSDEAQAVRTRQREHGVLRHLSTSAATDRNLGCPTVNVAPPYQPGSQYDTLFHTSHQTERPRAVDGSGALPTQVLQSAHAVYLNSPPFGFALQYHPQQPRPQVLHHPHQSMGGSHTQQDYVSIVPIHRGAPTPVAGVSSTFAYWHTNDVASVTSTATATSAVDFTNTPLEAGGGRTRAGTSCLNTSSAAGRHAHNRVSSGFGVRSPMDKGRTRRGGGQAHRRGGGNSDIQLKQSVGTSVSSAILDEFRSTKNREWTVTDIRGHVVEFCQDQNGSRLIQQRLEIGDRTEQQIVMSEVLPAVRLLRNDVFGNYVVQKLLERGSTSMKATLRDTLGGEMLPLSLQMYGCRVVQKALETLDEDDLPELLLEFHHNVLSCIHDQNGNHVIQKCIEVISSRAKKAQSVGDAARAGFLLDQIDFVIEDVLDNVAALACHPYGCRVLQRILEHCDGGKKERALDEVRRCHGVLLDDQYGNYVIQHVLKYGRHSDRESVLNLVISNGLLTLSKQKFASNVVEKLLQYGTANQRNAIVTEMLKVVDEDNDLVNGEARQSTVVLLMVRDAYANYVVQTALDVVAEGEEKRLLIEELKANSSQLRNYTFAKHIATKLSC